MLTNVQKGVLMRLEDISFKNNNRERKSMKNKKIKFLSGVSSLIVALSAVSTGVVSATEPNASMPNISESVSAPITADYIRNANEREIFDAIKSTRAMELPSRDFAHSLCENRGNGINLKGKFKLFSYYTFVRVLTTKGKPLPTDEEINWDTYNQPDYKFCLDIRSIVWKNRFYGEEHLTESFHHLCCAITLMTNGEGYCSLGTGLPEYDRGDEVEGAFEILEITCKYLPSSPVK